MENLKTDEPIVRTRDNCAVNPKGVEKGKCRVILGGVCVNPQTCGFHKTEAEMQKSYDIYCRRMNSLSDEAQRFYAEKYHRGKTPWKKVGDAIGQKE